MKKVTRIISIFVVLALICFIGFQCSKQEKKIVARVGGRTITIEEFEREFGQGRSTEQVNSADLATKKEFLNTMIDKKLQLIDAYQNKADENEKIVELLENRTSVYMFRRLIDKEVIEKIIPESRIKEYYKKTGKQVKIRQIFLKFDSHDQGSKLKIKELADDLARRIKHGEDFGEMAKSNSNDINTAKKGGVLNYMSWNVKSANNPLYVAAFSMKENEISDPIETKDGYYIIKVVHIKKLPLPPYDIQKERIRQAILKMHSSELTQAYYDYIDELKKKYKFKYNGSGLQTIVSNINQPDRNSNDSQQSQSQQSGSLSSKFSKADMKKSVVELSFKNITIGDFIEEVEKHPSHRRPMFKTDEDVEDFVDRRLVNFAVLKEECEQKNIQNDPVVESQRKNYQESLMLNQIKKERVFNKIDMTPEALKKFFEENREDYKHPPMREVQEIYVNDKSVAEKVVQEARKGLNFTALFGKYNKKKSLDKNNGKHGFISEGRAGIGKPAFAVEVGGITEPIRIGNGYSIVKVFKKKPATLKTFEEAKTVVKARYRRDQTRKIEEAWINRLRETVDWAIYEKNLTLAGQDYVGSDVLLVE